MKTELDEIISLIEDHFQKCIWNSRPPIKDVDFHLIILSQKIVKLRDNLNRIKLNEVDKEIKKIMTFMEETFDVPMLDEDYKNKIRRNLLLKVYDELSNLKAD